MPKSRKLLLIVVVGYFAKSVPLRNCFLLNISYRFDVSSTEIVVLLNTSLFNYRYFMVIIRRTIVTIGIVGAEHFKSGSSSKVELFNQILIIFQ